MVIDFGVITNWSGLAKAITYTIRVMFRRGIKTVPIAEIIELGNNNTIILKFNLHFNLCFKC